MTPAARSATGTRQLSGRRRHRSARVHPVSWFGPVIGSVVAILAWLGITHSSGSGWVQTVGALLAATLLTGLLAPSLPAHRADVACLASPADTTAGRTVTVLLEANGPVRLRPVQPPGPTVAAAGARRGTRVVELECTPPRRGVLDGLVVEVASSAPFGLLWWARQVEVSLTRPMHVAPKVAGGGSEERSVARDDGTASRRTPSAIGEPRGVRPYRAGDTRRAVHWPATAHARTLMVRDRERPLEEAVTLEVVLPRDPLEADTVAERAMATGASWLVRGRPVLLGTLEPNGRVARTVFDRVELGRRLARAVAPPDPDAVAGRVHRRWHR